MDFVKMTNQMHNLDVDALKKECIQQFMTYIKQLQKGNQTDYSHIMNIICLINSYEKLDNRKLIAQYLLNYVKPYIHVCSRC